MTVDDLRDPGGLVCRKPAARRLGPRHRDRWRAGALIAAALAWQILDVTRIPSVEAANLSADGNRNGHILLPLGTLLGRAIYPLWIIVLGWRLLRDSGLAVGAGSSVANVPRSAD